MTAPQGAIDRTPDRPPRSIVDFVALSLAYGSALTLVSLLLVLAGGPITTPDLWWHLKLGEAFAAAGPWLNSDPMLFAAPHPPEPAAWLFDVGLFEILRFGGFPALRVVHVLSIAAIHVLAWRLLFNASRSKIMASFATAAFALLVAYRAVQLRPHLFTIFAVLLLYALLMEKETPPSARRILAASFLCGLWSNIHASFLLGPILIVAAATGAATTAVFVRAAFDSRLWQRAARLAMAAMASLVATLANPRGASAHLSYFLGGRSTPDLTVIRDEWAAFHPFQLPAIGSLPTPPAWGLEWMLIVAVLMITGREAIHWLRARNPDRRRLPIETDLALLALSAASIIAGLIAVRFLWLGIFPLLLISRCWRAQVDRLPRPLQLSPAFAAALLVPLFVLMGDWAISSRGLPHHWQGYSENYSARRFYGHGVWFLKDTQITGNLFSDYFMGGFLGFWLAPRLKTLVNGSLNVPIDVMDAYTAIRHRRGLGPDGDFLSLLDDRDIDLFFGLGIPTTQRRNQPNRYTTTHLERSNGNWIPVFRNLRSSVYLRANERNRSNLDLITNYYAREGVPFDPVKGFDVERVIHASPGWAFSHGIIPQGFSSLARSAVGPGTEQAFRAAGRLTAIYGTLGLYQKAAAIDGNMLSFDAPQLSIRRHLIWCLLRLGEIEKALEEAQRLEGLTENDFLATWIARTAREYAGSDDATTRDGQIALLPAFYQSEARWLFRNFMMPESRDWPSR